MKAVIQRVKEASVTVAGERISSIAQGYLILLGVGSNDTPTDASLLSQKIVHLRLFPNDEGKFDRSLMDIDGEILVVSQFTLLADCRKGRRPSFHLAAPPSQAEALYLDFVRNLNAAGLKVKTGQFQAAMQVTLTNDGPVTIVLDSAEL